MSTRAELVNLAKLAEQGERYDDMVEYMKQVSQCSDELKPEERNLLSVAYKNVVGARRTALRILGSIKEKEEKRDPEGFKLQTVNEYRLKLEGELDNLCFDLLDQVLNENMLNKVTNTESRVFFFKMKGDYYRYMAEYKEGDSLKMVCKNASECYSKAWDIAEHSLASTDPIRLGLVLNYSVYHYEIMNEPDKACELAKKSFEIAKNDIDSIKEDSYKDSMLILQLLRDNLSLWTQHDPAEQGDEDAEELPKQDGDA